MALRLMQVVVPEAAGPDIPEPLEEGVQIVARWRDKGPPLLNVFHVLTTSRDAERVMDRLHQRYKDTDRFSVLLLPIQTVDPPPGGLARGSADTDGRLGRSELRDEIAKGARLTSIFMAMTVLSAIVAIIGLTTDDTAAIIGAMVIAPLLGPNVALAFAATLGDWVLGKRALLTNLVGVAIALSLSVAVGALFDIDLTTQAIEARIAVSQNHVLLALAAGAAGTLALTSGLPSTLVGVMVAVALLPPLVTFGLLLGAGRVDDAMSALLLLTTNVVSVNVAGIATFLWRGVRPRTWWGDERGTRQANVALVLWTLLLAVLIALIASP